MKSILTGIAPAMLAVVIGFTSCQKNIDKKSAQTVATGNLQQLTSFAASQSFINVADAEVFAFTVDPQFASTDEALVGSCPPVTTFDNPEGVYPRTVTIDWGTGCTSNGIRSGCFDSLLQSRTDDAASC